MKFFRVTYLALGAFAFAASCSKEAAEPDVLDWMDGRIHIRPSISDVTGSRGQDMNLDRLESFQVTCFNTVGISAKTDYLSPYFEDATFVRRPNLTYVSAPDEDPRNWPSDCGLLRFFAFSPSLTNMGGDAKLKGSASGYLLDSIRINPDISRQIDFITAEASGQRIDFTGGVELAFSHRLCQVELKAWGDGSAHDFEIAGVRIGNPVVEGSFVFADDSAPDNAQGWDIEGEGTKDKVEYLYGSSLTADKGVKSDSADRIFRINNSEHNTADKAGSIMGQAGCAMVIPTLNARWEGLSDPNISNSGYSTDRMYFSILTRVTDSASGSVLYPYPGNPYRMKVLTYAVDSDGRILTRLYAGETDGAYFTDPELKSPYVAPEGTEIKDFGWAAIPVDADWSAGKRYVYTLNYSEGIGLHDPEDPDPGKPIAGQPASIGWSVGVETWEYASKDDNFDPDLNVPFE